MKNKENLIAACATVLFVGSIGAADKVIIKNTSEADVYVKATRQPRWKPIYTAPGILVKPNGTLPLLMIDHYEDLIGIQLDDHEEGDGYYYELDVRKFPAKNFTKELLKIVPVDENNPRGKTKLTASFLVEIPEAPPAPLPEVSAPAGSGSTVPTPSGKSTISEGDQKEVRAAATADQ